MNKPWMLAIAGSVGIITATLGDEIRFKSGDRLTGTIKSVAAGKMVFESAVAGSLTLKMEDIQTFSTETPIQIDLGNGKVLMRKVAASDTGFISIIPDGAVQPQSLPLAEVVKINPEKPRWKGAVTAGATLVRGNSESSTATVNGEAQRRTENTRTLLSGGYYFANQRDNNTRDNSTSADNWFLKGQYDYFLTKQLYGYGNLHYEKDRIADLDKRITPGIGLGYQWVEQPDLNFSTEGGVNWVYEKYTDPEETRTYMAGRLAYHLDKSFNSFVKGFHNMEYIPSFEQADAFLVNTDAGLRAALTANLVLDAKMQMAYNSQPADDRDKKDLRYILGIGWTF